MSKTKPNPTEPSGTDADKLRETVLVAQLLTAVAIPCVSHGRLSTTLAGVFNGIPALVQLGIDMNHGHELAQREVLTYTLELIDHLRKYVVETLESGDLKMKQHLNTLPKREVM